MREASRGHPMRFSRIAAGAAILAGCARSAPAARVELPPRAQLESPVQDTRSADEADETFVSALAEYSSAVRRLEAAGSPGLLDERAWAVGQLADVIGAVPQPGHALPLEGSAALMRRHQIGMIGAPQDRSRDAAEQALEIASQTLSTLAAEVYASSPAVRTHAAELERIVQRLRASEELSPSGADLLDALRAAERTLNAIYAVRAGRGRP